MNFSNMPSEPKDCVFFSCLIVNTTVLVSTGWGRKGVLFVDTAFGTEAIIFSLSTSVCVSSYVVLPTLPKNSLNSCALFTISSGE